MIKNRILLILGIAIICLVIAVALYFIPYPTDVNVVFQGAVVTADGTVLETVEIHVDGWEHKYLFQENLMQLRIFTDSSDWGFAMPARALSPQDLYIDVPYMSIPTHIGSHDDNSFGYYALSIEHGYFIAGRNDDNTKFLIGSTDTDTESTTILAYFSDWIEFYFPAE